MLPSPIRKFTVNSSSDVVVDKYGQMKNVKFAGKVTSDTELASDIQADDAYYDSLKPPADRDNYGGLAGSAEKNGLEAKGYFAIQQLDGRKVMTTPNGDLYFSLAVNGITPNETYTKVTGREQKFESIPPYEGNFKRAFTGRTTSPSIWPIFTARQAFSLPSIPSIRKRYRGFKNGALTA